MAVFQHDIRKVPFNPARPSAAWAKREVDLSQPSIDIVHLEAKIVV